MTPIIRHRRFRPHIGRRASVALLFALSLIPIVITVMTAVDMSRLADGRAALQRAVDNAALSAAGAYSSNAGVFNTLAYTTATGTFCLTISGNAGLPEGFTLVGSGTVSGTQPESCATGAGPSVAAALGGYKPGTPGIAAGSGCTATNTVVPGYECGFIVTVVGTATMNSSVPALFGATKTISTTGIALNPFINIANTLKTILQGSAYNDNSLWIYPLQLNNQGQPDFASNPGALPSFNTAQTQDATPAGCSDNPTTTACGSYSEIADTAYTSCTAQTPCYNGTTEYIAGVVQNPTAPAAVITATTPIGLAMRSIAGGTDSYGYKYGSGNNGTLYGSVCGNASCNTYNPSQANGCNLPGDAVYGTVAQVYDNQIFPMPYKYPNSADPPVGGAFPINTPLGNPAGNPALPWPIVTHWFFSSYLANPAPLPPSEGEILSQTGSSNLDVPSIGFGYTQSNGQGTFTPSNASCAPNYPAASTYDEIQSTFYPSSGQTNRSLFIIQAPPGTAYVPPANTLYANPNASAFNPGYLNDDTSYYFTPANTPGQQYAALSCQAYGNNQFTFYWNDMGGSPAFGDTYDYGNGTVQITCGSSAAVVLIG